MDQYGTPLPQEVLDSVRRNRIALKGPITTPIGKGFRSVNVALRKELDLYACVRPCKYYPGIRSRYTDVNLLVVRENTEDLYAGVEWDLGTPEADKIIGMAEGRIREDSAISIKPISVTGTRRIVKLAFDQAIAQGRRTVTAVCKANIMKFTDGLFYSVAREVARAYGARFEPGTPEPEKADETLVAMAGKASGIVYNERLVDNMCMQLVQKPELYDVIVLPNLYGDIITDEAAQIQGGVGTAGSANIGKRYAMFEAIHGSAPRMVDEGRAEYADPSSMVRAAALLLAHIGRAAEAERLNRALELCTTHERKVVPTGRKGGATGREFSDYLMQTLDDPNLFARVDEYRRIASGH